MGSGGGGDNGMQMMMMMLMQQQQQQQMEEQRKAADRQAFQAAQRGEDQNYQRYQDLLTTQNKKVGDQWDLYNQNIDKIMKINPQYTAHQRYAFNPYSVNSAYRKSTDLNSANQNQDLLNQWYSGADRQALDDYNMAKSQYDASKNWLSDAQSTADAANRGLPAGPPGTWGAGGGMVSGEAGADANKTASQAIGDASGMAGVFSGLSSGTEGAPSAQMGMIGEKNPQQDNSLAGAFLGDTASKKTGSGSSIF